ncbi:MAG: hypothetical protein R2762_07120 [Bryobacteraceae bacterium]
MRFQNRPMLRVVIFLLVAIVLIALLRGSIGLIVRAVGEFLDPPKNVPARGRRSGQVQCPMCGSWVEPPVPPKE